MRAAERTEKRARVRALLDAEDLDALVLRQPGNVAWYSGGGRTHMLLTQEVGVAAVVITRDRDEVVTAVNEAARLESEELGGLEAEFRVLPWNADLAAALPRGSRVGADGGLDGARDVSAAVEAARRTLVRDEVTRYEGLGRDTAAALTLAARSLDPAQTEFAAAARVAAALVERGADPIVLLVAGEERLPRHRHPLPTGAPLGRLAMVVVCARRSGLIANLTRFVSFGGLAGDVRDGFDRLLRVDAAFNLATHPGRTVGSAFAAGVEAYVANGFDRLEWQLHHQGGPTGYFPRDYVATAESASVIEEAQAFAWNPSGPSVKSEDTILATTEGPEVLTVDPRWPTTDVDGLARPAVLER